jgi:transposase-like protein
MRELSVVEQRYEAARAVIADGETVTDVAARFGVARKTEHVWLARYEVGDIEALADRSHRPRSGRTAQRWLEVKPRILVVGRGR